MAMTRSYASSEPARSQIDALQGPALLEFGTAWCGHCLRAQSLLETAFAEHPNVQHIKVEDGSGRPLGRSFGVRLWPTLIFLENGREVARVVRPANVQAISEAFAQIDRTA